MERYEEVMGFPTFSALVATSFNTQEKIFPIGSTGSESSSLLAQLKNIEEELKGLRVQKELLQKQEATTDEQLSLIRKQNKQIEEDLAKFPLEQIPSSKEITKRIFDLFNDLKKYNISSIKDFVLMGELRKDKSYKDEYIWVTLVKLKEMKKLNLKNGEWSLVK